MVLEAIRDDAWALEYADDSLKSDRELVIEAVSQATPSNGYSEQEGKEILEFASEELKNDPELQKIAK